MLSVVVPAYNERRTISACLSAIAKQRCELITVVGGSDGTATIARRYGKVVIDRECIGAGHARNLGAKAAHGGVVLFTDGDTVVPNDWAASYAKVFKYGPVAAAGGVVRPLGGSLLDRVVFKINQDWLYRATAAFGFYQFSGNNCAYRRKDFLAAGGFDEGMTMLEDTELPLRLKGKKMFVPGIAVRTSPRRMRKQGYARTWLKFMRAYAGWLFGRKPADRYFASAKARV